MPEYTGKLFVFFGNTNGNSISCFFKWHHIPAGKELIEEEMWRSNTFQRLKQQYYLYNFVAPLRI